jgi:hypothetical protein
MSLVFRIIPELELFPTANERINHSHVAMREVLRPSTFWSPGGALIFVASYVALFLIPSFGSLDWLRPPLIILALLGVPLAIAGVGVRRFRRVIREQLVVAGIRCCLNCGYSMEGLEPPIRCPECNADCSNLLAHAGTPIPETAVFPQLLSFSRPGEAREALQRAYAAASVFYTYRFRMLLPIAALIALIFMLVSDYLIPERGDTTVWDASLICLAVAAFITGATLWHRTVRNTIREALDRELADRPKPNDAGSTP